MKYKGTSHQNTSPRLPAPTENEVQGLTEQDLNYTTAAIYRMGETLALEIGKTGLNVNNWLNRCNPEFFNDASQVSRIVNHTAKRCPSAGQLFEMRRIFGLDLNALADGGNPQPIEETSNEKLIATLNQNLDELSRRICQK